MQKKERKKPGTKPRASVASDRKVGFRVTEGEYHILKTKAFDYGKPLAVFLRDVALEA